MITLARGAPGPSTRSTAATGLPRRSSGSAAALRRAAAARRRRPSLRAASQPRGALNSLDSSDGEDYDLGLSRELERRSGSYQRLAAHLELLYNAQESASDTVEQCQCCRGSGERECNWCHGTGAMTIGDVLYCSEGGCSPCPVCRGTGQCKCPHCRGTGKRASWLAQGPPSC